MSQVRKSPLSLLRIASILAMVIAPGRISLASFQPPPPLCGSTVEGQTPQLVGIISDHLVSLDRTTGDATDLGAISDFSSFLGITDVAGMLYGIADAYNYNGPKVVRINPTTRQANFVANITLPGQVIIVAEGMTFNPVNGLLYAAAGQEPSRSSSLVTINPTTGIVTLLAPITETGDNEADALEYTNGTLYAVDVLYGYLSKLYAVDPVTGVGTFIGDIGFNNVNDLAYDPETQTLYGTSATTRQLVSISLSSGQGTLIGTTHSSSEFGGAVMNTLAILGRHMRLSPGPGWVERCEEEFPD